MTALIYNPVTGDEKEVEFYRSTNIPITFLSWYGGPRSTLRLRRTVIKEIWLHIAFFTLFLLPTIGIGIWFAHSHGWKWWLALAFFVELESAAAYANRFFYLKWRFYLTFTWYSFSAKMGWVHDQIYWFHLPHWFSTIITFLVGALIFAIPISIAFGFRDD